MDTRNNLLHKYPAIWLVLLGTAGTFALTMGARQSMGLFLSPMNTATGLGVGNISLAFAFGQLWWGLTQPFAGAFADKMGAGRVLCVGIILVAVGTFITPLMTTTAGLIFAIGMLAAGGAGMAGPAVLMATATRMIPAEKRGIATGIVNAGGSFGQFLMAPIAITLMGWYGWNNAMQIMGILVLLALPAAYLLRGKPVQAASTGQAPVSTSKAISIALKNPSYLMLAAGFFVCGFHVAFLATHLPGVISLCGLPAEFGGWALAMLGLFNIIGSISMGWAVGKWRMKSLLSLLYATRAIAIILFLLAPKNGTVVLIFAAVMGLTFLSTVPPTAGLVAKLFGPANMASLFGIVMLTHQLGGFLGVWLGGKVLEANGNFNLLWYIDITLAVAAALVHLPIHEKQLQLQAA
ncbi:MFS transporter [Undibacterium sp. YM2]|uniref:MFS transporter n=1 Tax=Undibacterium sp. YM2 TaxID=2058625 RepID=UPI001331DAA6|nr:MFS transporter [Undibacterium sp. YM2]BBB67541.1 MFS transporter [Undibacterium sp. YM2]